MFNSKGKLTDRGYRQFWIAISDAIHKNDNMNRINENKIRAKNFAAQIPLTTEEICDDISDSDISDVELLNNDNPQEIIKTKQHGKIKRDLLPEFQECVQHQLAKSNMPRSNQSNDSEYSEYFTVNSRHKHMNQPTRGGGQFHHKFCLGCDKPYNRWNNNNTNGWNKGWQGGNKKRRGSHGHGRHY